MNTYKLLTPGPLTTTDTVKEEMLVDRLKSETPEQWARRMLLRHIRRTPPGNDNVSLIAVFVEE